MKKLLKKYPLSTVCFILIVIFISMFLLLKYFGIPLIFITMIPMVGSIGIMGPLMIGEIIWYELGYKDHILS